MRYSLNENSVLVGQFEPGSTVNIEILLLETDTLLILDDDVCAESSFMPGVFTWNTSNLSDLNNINGYVNLLYKMTSDQGDDYYGKFVFGGYVDLIDDDVAEDVHNKILEWLYIISSRQ